jgi:hypothetical protein
MSKKRKHSSCSLKDKLELLKRIDKGESSTKLALELFFTSCSDEPKFRVSEVRISEALLYCIGLHSVPKPLLRLLLLTLFNIKTYKTISSHVLYGYETRVVSYFDQRNNTESILKRILLSNIWTQKV